MSPQATPALVHPVDEAVITVTAGGLPRIRELAVRHALPSAIAAAALTSLSPGVRGAVEWSLAPLFERPAPYVFCALGLVAGMLLWTRGVGRRVTRSTFVTASYLLSVACAEEWLFRFALPALLAPSIGIPLAAVLSNVVFALLHHFTLRWPWSSGALLFAMGFGLSMLLALRYDAALVIAIHWLTAFLITPLPPRLEAVSRLLAGASQW